MLKYEKDKLLLLKTLRDFINEAIENTNINPLLEQEVADFLIEITDKKNVRRLKIIRKALDRWIKKESKSHEIPVPS